MADKSTLSIEKAERVDHQLVRGIGVPALTANIVSSTIGAGIFVIPATVARGLGPAAPLAFVCCAIAMVLFVTCFAIAGSRVSLTGGLYAYVEVAFGRYVGFLAGMLYFLTALGAVAGVVNVLANSVALVVPFFGSPVMRIIVMLAVYGSLVLINIRGVRQGAAAVTVITLAKLLPLLLFIFVGIFFIHAPNLAWGGWPSSKSLGDAVILLIFAFVGIEVALIPSGEVKNPARTVPRSAYLALVITTIIYLMIQLVAQGTLGPDLANHSDAPLAESAATFLGNLGRMVLLAGASISAFGFVTSDILSSPRMIFAFGRDGALPQFFAHVHPRYRSPDVAIITYAALAFLLSISGTFEKLAVIPSVSTDDKHKEKLVECAEWLVNKLNRIGLQTQLVPTERHPIVWARNEHRPGRRTVLIYGHYDVQPLDPLELWDSPPFEPVLKDGYVFARGATDNKGQILAHILGIQEMIEQQSDLPVNLHFVIEGEEEIGSGNLGNFLNKNKDALRCDVALVSDTGMIAPRVPT